MGIIHGRKKLVKDVSANTLQTVIVQVFGLVIFFFTSRYLPKDNFGEFNWSMAVGSTAITALSMGIDLIFVKRVATSNNVLIISGIHFFHTILVGLLVCFLTLFINVIIPSFKANHALFLYIFICLAINNIANSFKLCLTGLEAYKYLAILAFFSNALKLIGVLFLYFFAHFSLPELVLVYIIAAICELILGYYLLNISLASVLKPIVQINTYKQLISESLPQLGVVLFDSALARIDWILLGLLSTPLATAEYSFTYRVFELSKLPILVLAPILLTRFSKLFANNSELSLNQTQDINQYFRIELFLVMIIPITFICLWSPLIDYFTNGKYGLVNETTYLILAICVPIHAIINFLWTLAFVNGFLKRIMWITIIASLVNIVANFVLISMLAAKGAAVAFLLSTLVQLILYVFYAKKANFKVNFSNCLLVFTNALVAVFLGKLATQNVIICFMITMSAYLLMTFFTKQVELKKMRLLLFS